MKKKSEYSYNERLFSSGLRKKLHTARFHWLKSRLTELNVQSADILELGCFDGKTLDYLPTPPKRYLGLDANWENGLELAREKWGSILHVTFRECHTAQEMALNDETFSISICMDTLEHLAPDLIDPYLHELSKTTTQYIFISVPNEKGVVFFFKYLIKKIGGGDTQHYTAREFINATLGRMHKVRRKEHKGFDYEVLVHSLEKYFDIYEMSGYPFPFLPVWLNFGVGIIGIPYATEHRTDLDTHE